MRYVVFVKLTGQAADDYENGRMPTQDELSSMMTYNQALVDAGIMVGGDGLHPTSKSVRVEFDDKGTIVSDGPFAEAKELIGGFWLWTVSSREEAVAWAEKCPMHEGDVLELRRIFDPEDFGDAIGPAEQAQIDEIAAKLEARKR